MFLLVIVVGMPPHAIAAPPNTPPPAVAQLGSAGTTPLRVVQTLRHSVTAGLSKTMFATSNQINSSTITVEVLPTSVNLWEGTWAPGPMDPPMNGVIPSIKSGACCETLSACCRHCVTAVAC